MGRHTPLRVAFRRPWPGTRRGLKLWLFAIVIAFKGLAYIQAPADSFSDSALRLLTDTLHLSLAACGWSILAVCGFALWCSYCHHGRDRYGFIALVGFSGMWASVYATSRFFLDAPYAATQGALSWLVIAGLLLVVANDPEPLPPPPKKAPE